jgi:cytoskeletal protein CcmA (bactofilin family)
MALRGMKSRGEKSGEEVRQAAAESAPPARIEDPTTCIDATSEVSGTIRSRENVRIAGRLEGEIHCEQTVIVTESGSVNAVIEADSVRVSGEVRGDIAATRKITLDKTARVTGDLRTLGIVIEEGAKLEGRIVIGSDEAATEAPKAQSIGAGKSASPAVRDGASPPVAPTPGS